MKDLRQRIIRAGSARVCTLAANFFLRVGSLMILARVLDPTDFGLVGMVMAVTGVLDLFRDFGLSAVSIQRSEVTEEQTSTLFWINVLVGAILTMIAVALAPLVAFFYHDPRLLGVTTVMGIVFVINGFGVQHSALLQRQMRFTTLGVVEVLSATIATLIAIGMAKLGYGYWALVANVVSMSLATTFGLWLATQWVPGVPRKGIGVWSMLRFGGTMTLNGLILYATFNLDKVLLGRFFGAEAIGIYGRASQLIRIPVDNLNSAVGGVAFAALSRLQNDPERLKRYFMKGYSLVVTLTLPITVGCALFSDDLVFVLLGPKWTDVSELFRIMAPTILVFAITNPIAWLLNSLGLVERLLKIALAFAPFMIAGYAVGLLYGPKGVAIAYSAVMVLAIVPIIAGAVRGTLISVWEILFALHRPLAATVAAAALAFVVQHFWAQTFSPLPRLLLEGTVFGITYFGFLLLAGGRKSFYLEFLTAQYQQHRASRIAGERH